MGRRRSRLVPVILPVAVEAGAPASAHPPLAYLLQPRNTPYVLPVLQTRSEVRECLIQVQVQRVINKPVCVPQVILPCGEDT